MKKTILCAILSGPVLAQDTTYFNQDFEDLTLRTWAQHVENDTVSESPPALPHVIFNDIRGGRADRAILDTTRVSNVITNRSLRVFIPDSTSTDDDGNPLPALHFGRSTSYYLGGKIVRGDPAVNKTNFSGGLPIYDSHVPDNDEMYFRYHVKLDPSWYFDENQIVKIPGLAGTYNSGGGGMWPHPPDSLGWSARMLAGRGPDLIDDPWPVNQWSPISYVYHLDQRCGVNDSSCGTGDHFPHDPDDEKRRLQWGDLPRLQMDQWYRIEQRIKMNDPDDQNDLTQPNGLIEVWIDGEKNVALSKK